MILKNYLFTSESVSEGHPDKVADRISDTILDGFLKQDAHARVALETLVTTNTVVLAGEVRVQGEMPNIEALARKAIKEIGYEQDKFHWQHVAVNNFVHEQSLDIAIGVDENEQKEEGAGDQGIMFGFATNETESLMPAPIDYSHKILEHLSKKRHSKAVKGLEPDSKSQVTMRYEDGKPVEITAIVVSHQHQDTLSLDDLKSIIIPSIKEVIPARLLSDKTVYHINPTGRFVIGGPDGDTGLTGRKIIVDTYGGSSPHGGGAFSGKDPTKVDRSAAYIARYLAKNVVAASLAKRCTIQLSYAIGIASPLSFYVNTYGTGVVDEHKLAKILQEIVPLTPKGIRQYLKLNNPIYTPTSSYGHFGRLTTTLENGAEAFTWEKTDIADALKKSF